MKEQKIIKRVNRITWEDNHITVTILQLFEKVEVKKPKKKKKAHTHQQMSTENWMKESETGQQQRYSIKQRLKLMKK